MPSKAASRALRASFDYYRAIDQSIPQNRDRMKTKVTLPILALPTVEQRFFYEHFFTWPDVPKVPFTPDARRGRATRYCG
jgi:hypothetical protein